ncbi:capsular polysaccharide export protein [Ceratobasidium sp. AG-Ba]|nr:capsular polysaccharide export protein [Ceratobasidium sp. AG-Ba]
MKDVINARSKVWLDPAPPSLVLLPFINHAQVHCYIAYGKVVRRPGSTMYDLHLRLLDSLGRPSQKAVEDRINKLAIVLRFVLPLINGQITGSYVDIPGYRQRPGSTDCGWFVCQAVSAIVHGQLDQLQRPLPIKLVKQQVHDILGQCKDQVLNRICDGIVAPSPLILHNRYSPPPWLSEKSVEPKYSKSEKPQWIPPQIERSLSVPPVDTGALDATGGSWEEVFGPRADLEFEHVSGEAFSGYLEAVGQGGHTPPAGLLVNVGGQIPDSVPHALLLAGGRDDLAWAPEAPSSSDSRDDIPDETGSGPGVKRFLQGLRAIPDGLEKNKTILTGERHIDSLSLTAENPQFTLPLQFYLYPPQASTLTTDNGLSVLVEDKPKKLSHIPNFTLAKTGSNNDFHVNIFFPNYDKGMNNGKRVITMLNDADFSQFMNEVLLPALVRVELFCLPNYHHAVSALRRSLPKSYQRAKPNGASGIDAFTSFRILPEFFNMLIFYCRKIVNFFPQHTKFRRFFFHVYGMGLKSIGQELSRKDGNALLHVLKLYPIVDWSLQNPRDIVVDVGLEINVLDEQLPNEIDGLTLIWKLAALERLAQHAWRQAHVNLYMHSHKVGGISSSPRTFIATMFYYMHAYMKDKVITCRHWDFSYGASFSPLEALSNSKRYVLDTTELRKRLVESVGSYGVRIEWRCGVWVAMEILRMDPPLWVKCFRQCNAIVAVQRRHVVNLKVAFLEAHMWFFSQLQRLSVKERNSEPAWSTLPLDAYKILRYGARKNPAGARIKSSHLADPTRIADTMLPLSREHDEQSEESTNDLDDDELRAWVAQHVNQTLGAWLWGCMAPGDKLQRTPGSAFCGPLVLRDWRRCVDQSIQYQTRQSASGFSKVVQFLFPPNWHISNVGRIWDTLELAVLDPIIARLDPLDPPSRRQYSQFIQAEISRTMRTWEYLPCTHEGTVWSYSGKGMTKTYMVYRNPLYLANC